MFAHLLIIEDIAFVLVKEEVVTEAEQLDFNDFRILFGAFSKNLDTKLLSLLNGVADFLDELWSYNVERKLTFPIVYKAKATHQTWVTLHNLADIRLVVDQDIVATGSHNWDLLHKGRGAAASLLGSIEVH